MDMIIIMTKLQLGPSTKNELIKALTKIGHEFPHIVDSSAFDIDKLYTFNGKYGQIKVTFTEQDMV
jgi:hypothetical protein